MSGATTTTGGMPVPMGVIAETGDTHPPIEVVDPTRIATDSEPVFARTRRSRALALEGAVDDPMDLGQAGWGLVLPADADPAIREALQPLLEWRKSQVADDRFFQIFEGPRGVRAGQTATKWAATHGVSLSAPVSPRKGVPYYLLLAGSPEQIPFEFQAQLDLQWAVGRLHFDEVADFARYATKVVACERGVAPAPQRRAAVWMPRNTLDLATAMLAGSVVPEFLGQTPGGEPLGTHQRFALTMCVGEGEATKARLAEILRGASGERPAIVFTGSHGAEWSIDRPEIQRERQGALVTQEWIRGHALDTDNSFSAADLASDATLDGTILVLFACFGGGCPAHDSYYRSADGAPRPLAPAPLVAKLPQVLLRSGALAIIAHVDRAFSYAFEDVMGTPQAQLLRMPVELLMKGRRVGLAAEPLNLQWSSLAAQLGLALAGSAGSMPPVRSPLIANLYIARDDARNYVVLGDPAVRLPLERMP